MSARTELRHGPFVLLILMLLGSIRPGDPVQLGPARPDLSWLGQRRIDWDPGIPGGIPSYPVAINVREAPYRARGDGIADDTEAIQKAIAACPSRSAIFLPAGSYRLTAPLDIAMKSIVLRGAGPDRTFLRCEASNGDVISIRGAGGAISSTTISSGATQGSTTVVVGNTSDLKPGDHLLISQANDPSVCEGLRPYQFNAIGQIVRISAISGKTLTLNRPLYYTYDPSFSPQAEKLRLVENAGVEDLHIERTVPAGVASIRLLGAAHCWVKNIESAKAAASHVLIRLGYGNVVRSSYFHHGFVYGGGAAYGVFLLGRCTDNLIEDNIFCHLRHAVTLEWGGCGNVIAYNYATRFFDESHPNTDWLMQSLHTHGGHPYMNLFEGNICPNITFDNALGSSRHNTVFRNHAERYGPGIKLNLNAIEVQMNNLYQNIIGNVLGRPGDTGVYEVNSARPGVYKLGCNQSKCDSPDVRVKETILRHGNYDHITKTTHWDTAIDERSLPDSLYLRSRPEFFGMLPWPMIGPDLEPKVGTLPAKLRFETLTKLASEGKGS